MKVFLKVLNSLKKSKIDNPYLNCQYDRGWNDAIAKVEELVSSYSVSDMWIPADVKLPPDPDENIPFEDLPEYIVTMRWASLPTSLTYIGDGEWVDVNGHRVGYPVAWMPMPEVYKEKGDRT